MARTEPLADSTIKQKARRANYGNVWVTELLSDGKTQNFYAIRVTVFTRQRFLRVLQDNGEYVDISFDKIIGLSTGSR